MQKYQYFEWGSTLNLDGFKIIIFQYIICEPLTYWKEVLTKLDVNLWEIWRKFKCRRSMSYPLLLRSTHCRAPSMSSTAVRMDTRLGRLRSVELDEMGVDEVGMGEVGLAEMGVDDWLLDEAGIGRSGYWTQWRNRRGCRGRVPPGLLTGKFLVTYREKRGKKKVKRGENWEEKKENNKENCKSEGGNLKSGRWKSYKMRRGPFFCFLFVCLFGFIFVLFFVFVFVLFCFVLFCFVLFCFVLFCFVFCFVLFFVLFCFVLFCFVLFCFCFCFFLFLFFCFCFFCFSLFKTTKICFGCTKMEIFYRERAFHTGEKSAEMTLPPQKNFPVTPLIGRSGYWTKWEWTNWEWTKWEWTKWLLNEVAVPPAPGPPR